MKKAKRWRQKKRTEACRVHWREDRGIISISADTVSGILARLVRAASDERRNLQKSPADRDKRARPMFANQRATAMCREDRWRCEREKEKNRQRERVRTVALHDGCRLMAKPRLVFSARHDPPDTPKRTEQGTSATATATATATLFPRRGSLPVVPRFNGATFSSFVPCVFRFSSVISDQSRLLHDVG